MREVWDSKLEVAAMCLGWVFGVCIENINFLVSMSVSVCSFTFLVLYFQYSPKLKAVFRKLVIFWTVFWFLCRPHICFERRISLETFYFFYKNGFPVLEIHQYFFRCLFLWLTSVKRHKWIYGFSVTVLLTTGAGCPPPIKKFHTFDLRHCRRQIV